ncbi:MAG: shikimate kinase [Bacillota bacterium]|nr:shikimate kinase [Bacillota bacterium]
MKNRPIFVTGYFGAPIRQTAKKLAKEKGWPLLDLDRIIEERDGRTVSRICMMNGEHGYRNREYEVVEELLSGKGSAGEARDGGLVIACGDGILYDDQTAGLLHGCGLVIAGEKMSRDCLWEKAKEDAGTWHAFMKFGSEEEKRAAFDEYHRRQQKLFAAVRREREKDGRD